jgi:hypothetical protein
MKSVCRLDDEGRYPETLFGNLKSCLRRECGQVEIGLVQ